MKRDSSKDIQLYNREVFEVLLEYEINRSQRYPSPICLLDILIVPGRQTTEPQQAMDAEISTQLNSHLRSADIPAKIGDQYLVLLPTTDERGARAVCERILSVFKSLLRSEAGTTFSVSVFIGLAFHPGEADLSSAILKQQAASALKHAHQQGLPTYTAYSDIQNNQVVK
ncbi:MAG: GGDEF domain-containing protein [Anaerolineales bacterium]|nr:GGDEF domain-containing protein [Anaerolineales bacterium]